MPFLKLDPSVPNTSVSLSAYGVEEGDVFTVRAVGDFDPWGDELEAWRSTNAVYNGEETWVHEWVRDVPADTPIGNRPIYEDRAFAFKKAGGDVLTLKTLDSIHHDNEDDDRDYGVVIERFPLSPRADIFDFADLAGSEAARLHPDQLEKHIYNARGGDDIITLPAAIALTDEFVWNPEMVFRGGKGRDEIVGQSLQDRIDGGPGNDTLEGGGKADELDGGRGASDIARFDKPWKYVDGLFRKNGDKIISRVEGKDTLTDIEFAEFSDDRVLPLAEWEIRLKRKDDGDARILLYKDGKKIAAVDGHYDDATPVPDGSYGALLRLNAKTKGVQSGGKNWVIELADQANGGSTVEKSPGLPARSSILLHQGGSPHNSDGCGVLKSNALKKILLPIINTLDDAGAAEFAGALKTYKLPFPIKVTMTGNIKQPTLSRDGAKVEKTETGETSFVAFSLDDGRNDQISKRIWLDFKLEQSGKAAKQIAKSIEAGDGVVSATFRKDGHLIVVLEAKRSDFELEMTAARPGRADFDLVDAGFLRKKGGEWVKQQQTKKQVEKLLTESDRFSELDFSFDVSAASQDPLSLF